MEYGLKQNLRYDRVHIRFVPLNFQDAETQRREWKRNRGIRQRRDRQPQMRYGTRLCRGWREGSVQLLTGGRRVSQPTTTLSLAILKPF